MIKTVSILRPQTTEAVVRGAARFLRRAGFVTVREMIVPSGRRMDLMALSPSGELLAVEVKSSVEDFRTDQKWRDYRDYSDAFAFAVAPEFPVGILPGDVGLLLADPYGGEWLREPPRHPLAGARRKALTLGFARLAAGRLHSLEDPDAL